MLSYLSFKRAMLTEKAGSIRPTSERAYDGRRASGRRKISKQATGAIGERIVMHHLKAKGHRGVHALNSEKSNYPVDVATRHHLVEVKTGLASNNEKSHHWRATIGQPGKKESEWLRKAKPEAKKAWNEKKNRAIMDRKNRVLAEHSKKHGVRMTGKTFGVILHHDRKVADVHEFDGFHRSLSWKQHATKDTRVGSYHYD